MTIAAYLDHYRAWLTHQRPHPPDELIRRGYFVWSGFGWAATYKAIHVFTRRVGSPSRKTPISLFPTSHPGGLTEEVGK